MQGVPCFQAATADELIKEVPITHSFTRCKPSPGSMQWSAVYRTVFDHLLSLTQHKQPRLSAAVSHVLNTGVPVTHSFTCYKQPLPWSSGQPCTEQRHSWKAWRNLLSLTHSHEQILSSGRRFAERDLEVLSLPLELWIHHLSCSQAAMSDTTASIIKLSERVGGAPRGTNWVVITTENGYTLQFACRPP